jgi:SAM-dependent methyltransferase
MNVIAQLTRGLGSPAGYRVFRRFVGGESVWRLYLAEYVRPAPGEKVLDIGCGPADVLEYLPKVDYLGLDISPEYITSARKRFGTRGRFVCEDIGRVTLEEEVGSFNLVLATGVLHHLDEIHAGALLGLARRALRPGGRLITFDGCYVPEQSRAARWLLSHDRGKFVRTAPEYLRLVSRWFTNIEPHVRHDLLRIPYTHLIMRCAP